jgi:hypothetical protein
MQATAQQIVNTYNAINGSYEATVLKGVWHAYCDSGIMTDALGERDAERCEAAGIDVDELDLAEMNEQVKAYDKGDDLDCVKCINAITALGIDVEEFFENINS